MSRTLEEMSDAEAPEVAEEWLDLSEVALGFDVLSTPGEVVLVVHMPEGMGHIGFSFDADGAYAFADALQSAAENAERL